MCLHHVRAFDTQELRVFWWCDIYWRNTRKLQIQRRKSHDHLLVGIPIISQPQQLRRTDHNTLRHEVNVELS
jgi:hypothetical protein